MKTMKTSKLIKRLQQVLKKEPHRRVAQAIGYYLDHYRETNHLTDVPIAKK